MYILPWLGTMGESVRAREYPTTVPTLLTR